MHAFYEKADRVSPEVIGAAIEVHRHKGPGLIESIYERCILRELELRSIPSVTQKLVRVEYEGLVFDESLRFDILIDDCLLLELKAVEVLHPFSKAQLFSYMKLLDVLFGSLINFHEPVLKNGISRMILPGLAQIKQKKARINEASLEAISQIGAGRVAGRFLVWARRAEEVYPQRSATEKQRSPGQKAAPPGGQEHSWDVWRRCSLLTDLCGYARRSRLAIRPKLLLRGQPLFVRWLLR